MLKKIVAFISAIAVISAVSGCYSEDDLTNARAEGYEAGYQDGYEALTPIARPVSGAILCGREYDGSELTIIASNDCDYAISLKDMSGRVRICFYVRAGDTVTVGVPDTNFYVYFASGEDWYGYGKGLMFGKDTTYSRDSKVCDFTDSSWEYTLYPVTGGNFSESPSTENDFF